MTDNTTLTEQPSGFAAVDNAANKTAQQQKRKEKFSKSMSFKDMFKRDISDVKRAFQGNKKQTPSAKQQAQAAAERNPIDPKTAHKEQRRKDRMGDDYYKSNATPSKLVPLQQADEMKVRQLAKRLNPEQAEQLGKIIGNLIVGDQQ